MTSCHGDCSTFSTVGARWFKLDASGYFPEEKAWGADKLRESKINVWKINILGVDGLLFTPDGNSWVSTIPSDLQAGQYVSHWATTSGCSDPSFPADSQ